MGSPSNFVDPTTIKDRLMTYPKEVIVDYFLEDSLPLYEIDFRKLEFRKCQARSKKLLEEWKQIEGQMDLLNMKTTQGRSEWWRLQGRISQIMGDVDRLSRKTSALLDITRGDR